MYDLNSIDKNINALREELLTLTVGIEKQAGDMKVLKERLSSLFERNKRLGEENEAMDAEYTKTLKRIEDIKLERDGRDAELVEARKQVDNYRAGYMAAVEKLTQGENSAQSNKQALMDAMDRLADIKANMSRLIAEREALISAVQDMDGRISSVGETLKHDEEQFANLKGGLVEIAWK